MTLAGSPHWSWLSCESHGDPQEICIHALALQTQRAWAHHGVVSVSCLYGRGVGPLSWQTSWVGSDSRLLSALLLKWDSGFGSLNLPTARNRFQTSFQASLEVLLQGSRLESFIAFHRPCRGCAWRGLTSSPFTDTIAAPPSSPLWPSRRRVVQLKRTKSSGKGSFSSLLLEPLRIGGGNHLTLTLISRYQSDYAWAKTESGREAHSDLQWYSFMCKRNLSDFW